MSAAAARNVEFESNDCPIIRGPSVGVRWWPLASVEVRWGLLRNPLIPSYLRFEVYFSYACFKRRLLKSSSGKCDAQVWEV